MSIHTIERLAVTIATSVAVSGFGGMDAVSGLPLDKIGGSADITAGIVFVYKAWSRRREATS